MKTNPNFYDGTKISWLLCICLCFVTHLSFAQRDVAINGSFEYGNDPWSFYGGAAIIQSSENVKFQKKAVKLPSGSGAELKLRGLKPNTNYRIRGWVKSPDKSEVRVGAKEYGGNDVFARVYTDAYSEAYVTFKTGRYNRSAIVYFFKPSSGADGYGDQIMVIEETGTKEYKLAWAEEFNYEGAVDTADWKFERGFVRNRELQYYTTENAFVTGGNLVFEGRRETGPNPRYDSTSTDWKKSRKEYNYTSSSINTFGKHSWLFGRIEVRAKVTNARGTWPAIWTLGRGCEWPSNGEVDIMENYSNRILANYAWGTDRRWTPRWDGASRGMSVFDDNWTERYHTWVLDWTEDYMKIFMDGMLMNEVNLRNTINGSAKCAGENPFLKEQVILLNLALGSNGGDPSNTAFPTQYLIDYVRVYQREEEGDNSPNPAINVALNKPVTVDSELGANVASRAVDGDIFDNGSRWVSANVAFPHWIEIDLEDKYSINELKFWTGWNGYNNAPLDFKFQKWNEKDSSWTDIITETNNRNSTYIQSFPPTNARKVRLYATRGNDNYLRMFEIEVYGKKLKEQKIFFLPIPKFFLKPGKTTRLFALAFPDPRLKVGFEVVSGPASIEKNKMTFTGVGDVTVRAYQPGNYQYFEADDICQTLTIEHPGENVALNKPTSVSSSLSTGIYPGENAVDGDKINHESRWVTDENSDFPHWVEIDLGDDYKIDLMGFWTGFEGVYQTPIKAFEFQTWDGNAWQTVFQETDNSNPEYQKIFSPVITNKVRLYMTEGNDNFARLYEIEIYGKKVNSSAPTQCLIFPNPTRRFITIATRDFKKAEIFAPNQEKVLESTSRFIDLLGLKPNQYIVKIYNKKGEVITKRLMVE